MESNVKAGMKRFKVTFRVSKESFNGYDHYSEVSYEIQASNQYAASNKARRQLMKDSFNAYTIHNTITTVIDG